MDTIQNILIVVCIFGVTCSIKSHPCTVSEKVVDCRNKNISVLPSNEFAVDINLIYLDGNKLDQFPNLQRFQNLKHLSLSNNSLRTFQFLGNLPPSIEVLDLSSNQFASTNGFNDIHLPKLQQLLLRNNSLDKVEDIFSMAFETLVKLDVSHNKITRLARSQQHLNKNSFPRLKLLALNDNQISFIEDPFFDQMTSVEKIVLSNNKLEKLTNQQFSKISSKGNLKELFLDGNQLTVVQILIKSLTILNVSNNRLQDFERLETFIFLEQLTELDLSGNQINMPSKKWFHGVKSITKLSLRNNNISSLDEDSFILLSKLEELDLSGNQISIGMREFEKVFLPLQYLKSLNLRDNNIFLLPTHAFRGLKNLISLDLSGNQIEYIEKDALSRLQHIQKLLISTSNLYCDCSIMWFREWLASQKTLRHTSITGTCSLPRWLENKDAMEILKSELTCDKQSKDYTIRPKIVIPPRSRHTEIYRNLSLSCVTTSSVDKPITIKWYHNGQLLMNAKVTKSPAALQRIRTNLFMHTSTLVLNKVRYEEKGKYSCEAINIYGSVKSIAANVTIVVPPYISKRPPWQIIKRTGEDVQLPCSAEGSPSPVVSFAKITGDETAWKYATIERRIHYEKDTFSFIVKDLKVEDSGYYACLAKSVAGKINATVQLIVIAKPSFIRPMTSKSVPMGTIALLDCIISGNPRPEITWFKGRQRLAASKRVTLTDQMLVINDFSRADIGSYTCHAKNDLGSASQSARLELSVAPVNVEQASQVNTDLIAMTVIIVFTITSFIWLIMFCFCRWKRKHDRAHATNACADDLALIYHQQKEDSVPELPKDFLLRCNGKVISRSSSQAIEPIPRLCDSAPLLSNVNTRERINSEQSGIHDSIKYLRKQQHVNSPPSFIIDQQNLHAENIGGGGVTTRTDYSDDDIDDDDQHDSGVLVHYKSGSSLGEQTQSRDGGRPYVTIDNRDRRKKELSSRLLKHHKHSASVGDASSVLNNNRTLPSTSDNTVSNLLLSASKRKRLLSSQSDPIDNHEGECHLTSSSGVESGVSSSTESISDTQSTPPLLTTTTNGLQAKDASLAVC